MWRLMIIGLCGVAGSGKDTVADFLVKNHGFVKVAFADPLKRICKDVFDFSDEQLWGPSEKRNAQDERYRRYTAYENGRAIDRCACEWKFRDAEDYRDHLPCPKAFSGPELLTPRYALQQLGSEWGRDCYQNVWVEYALRTAKSLLGTSSHNIRYDQKKGLYWLDDRRDWDEAERNEAGKAKGVVISDVRFRNEVDLIKAAGGKVVRIVRKEAGLKGAAAQHQSETEQLAIPDEVFDHHLLNGSTGLDLLEAVVKGLVDTLKIG